MKSNDIWGKQPLLRKLQSKSLIIYTNVVFKYVKYGQKLSFYIIEDIKLIEPENNTTFDSIMDLELKWNAISGADYYDIELRNSMGHLIIYGISTNKLIFKDLSNIEILQCSKSDKRRRIYISAGEYRIEIQAYKYFDGVDKSIRISHYKPYTVTFDNLRIIEEYELKDMFVNVNLNMS